MSDHYQTAASTTPFFVPLGHRLCARCLKPKPEIIFSGHSNVCPTCNANANIEKGEAALSEATTIMNQPEPVSIPVMAPAIGPLKHCAKCDTDKPRTEFGVNRAQHDGLQSYCKPCQRKMQLSYYHRQKKLAEIARAASFKQSPADKPVTRKLTKAESLARARAVLAAKRAAAAAAPVAATKKCYTCGRTKPLDQFHAHTSNKDGHSGKCKPCKAEYNADYARKKKQREYMRAYNAKRKAEAAALAAAMTVDLSAVPAATPPATVQRSWLERVLGVFRR